MVRILGIGDNTVDIYYDQGIQFPGGNAINVAVLSNLIGADAGYLGCISTDFFGDIIKNALIEEKVDISHSRYVNDPSSWSRIQHIEGDRTFGSNYENMDVEYNLKDADYTYISSFDVVHSSTYSYLEHDLENISNVAQILSFDFSNCHNAHYISSVAPHIDIAFLSAPDANDQQCEKLAKNVASYGPSIVIVTRGEKGSLAYDHKAFYMQGIIPTDVTDTLGAGDGFIAAFLNSWAREKDMAKALFQGASFAAKVCTYQGGFGHESKIEDDQPGLL